MTSAQPEPPAILGAAGRRLFKSVQAEYVLSGADAEVLRHACVQADVIDALEPYLRAGPLIKDHDGNLMVNPAIVQHRLTSAALAKNLASIRVIGDVDQEDGARPQHRSGFRGNYALRAVE